jgi:hypothetical protein
MSDDIIGQRTFRDANHSSYAYVANSAFLDAAGYEAEGDVEDFGGFFSGVEAVFNEWNSGESGFGHGYSFGVTSRRTAWIL